MKLDPFNIHLSNVENGLPCDNFDPFNMALRTAMNSPWWIHSSAMLRGTVRSKCPAPARDRRCDPPWRGGRPARSPHAT